MAMWNRQGIVNVMRKKDKKQDFQSLLRWGLAQSDWGPCPKFEIHEITALVVWKVPFVGALMAQFVLFWLVLVVTRTCLSGCIWLSCFALFGFRNFSWNPFAGNNVWRLALKIFLVNLVVNDNWAEQHILVGLVLWVEIVFLLLLCCVCVHYKQFCGTMSFGLVWSLVQSGGLVGWLSSLGIQSALPRLKSFAQMDDLLWAQSNPQLIKMKV